MGGTRLSGGESLTPLPVKDLLKDLSMVPIHANPHV